MKQYKIIDRVVVSAIIDNEIHKFPFDENSNVTVIEDQQMIYIVTSDGDRFVTNNTYQQLSEHLVEQIKRC